MYFGYIMQNFKVSMTKLVKTLIILFCLTLILAKDVSAETLIYESSARPRSRFIEASIDRRQLALKRFLKTHNSPLAKHSKNLVSAADQYHLDWRLVAAIAGVESTFGKNTPVNSYNAYGWANGAYYFNSWEESIVVVSETLRTRYIDRGATNISKIARIYAPPSQSWAWKVRYFMQKIEPLPVEFAL